MVRKKRGHDFAVNAFRVVQEATEEREPEKLPKNNFEAKELGRKGVLNGDKPELPQTYP